MGAEGFGSGECGVHDGCGECGVHHGSGECVSKEECVGWVRTVYTLKLFFLLCGPEVIANIWNAVNDRVADEIPARITVCTPYGQP